MLDARYPALLAAAALATAPALGHAQASDATPTAVLVPPTHGEDTASVARALDRILRARLDAQAVVELGPTPALGLEDLLLALGCVAESPDCLGQLATQLEADELLIVDLERVDGALVVSLRRLRDGELEVTTRQYPGEGGDRAALDDADALLRQAYGLPPAPVRAPASPGDAPPPPAVRDGGGYEPILPIVLIGTGLAAMGAGVGVGVASQESLAAYEASPVGTEAEIDAALARYDEAEALAIAADVLLPVGGALAAAGAVVWIVGSMSADGGDDEGAVAWDLSFGPGGARATLSGRFDGGAR